MDLRNTFLAAEKEKSSSYYHEFIKTVDDFSCVLGSRVAERVEKNKLYVSTEEFNTEPYIQGAAEVTVVRYFLNNFASNFEYEPELNRPKSRKNVECTIRSQGFQFNIEVKVADHTKKIADEGNPGIKIESFGRFEEFKPVTDDLIPLFGASEPSNPARVAARLENNLWDHLKSANEKFPADNPRSHCNIVFVGCGSSDDIQAYYGYLTAANGFFTKTSFKSHLDFNRVDLVYLTNLHFKHSATNGVLDEKSWQLENCFSIGIPNPFAEKSKREAVTNAIALIPSQTIEFKSYCEAMGERLLEMFCLKIFIHKELGENQHRYYYEPTV